MFDLKVDKEEGKGLSTEDFTSALKEKLENLQNTDPDSFLQKGTYTGTAQDLKTALDNILAILQSDDTELDQLQEIVNYIKQNKKILGQLGIPNIAGLVDALSGKVDKVEGKGLSTHDFTSVLKTGLEKLLQKQETQTAWEKDIITSLSDFYKIYINIKHSTPAFVKYLDCRLTQFHKPNPTDYDPNSLINRGFLIYVPSKFAEYQNPEVLKYSSPLKEKLGFSGKLFYYDESGEILVMNYAFHHLESLYNPQNQNIGNKIYSGYWLKAKKEDFWFLNPENTGNRFD